MFTTRSPRLPHHMGRLLPLCIAIASILAPTFAPVAAQTDPVADVQAILASGKAAEGLKMVDDLLKAKPTDPRLRLQRGIALSLLGRNAEAITVFKKLTETNPEMPGPYNNLAVLYANQGDYEKARQSLEQAVKANPGYATAYQNLGDIHARLAEKAYAKSLSLDKSDLVLPLKITAIQRVFEPGAPAKTSPTQAAPAQSPAAPAVAKAALAAPAASVAPSKGADPLTSAVLSSLGNPAPKAAPSTPKPAQTAVAPVLTAAPKPAAPAATPKVDPVLADSQAVQKALEAWAQAWSKRDMWGYYAAYTPEFKGKAASRKDWEAERNARITGKKEISVQLSDMQVKVSGSTAKASFKQDYRADAMKMSNAKTLDLVKGKTGDWQISSESSN